MDKQAIIRRIRELKAQGLTFQAISDAFNTEGVSTFSGRGVWNKGTVLKILKSTNTESPVKLIKQESEKPDTVDRTAILQSYDRVKRRIRFSDVEISELQKESGCDMESLKAFLLSESRAGNAVLSYGDWSLSDENVRSGAIHIRGKAHLLVCFKDTAKQPDTKEKEISVELIKQPDIEISKLQERIQSLERELIEKDAVILNLRSQLERSTPLSGNNIAGWTLKESGGYYRAFRTIAGKVHGVYIGKTADPEIVKSKVSAKEKELENKGCLLIKQKAGRKPNQIELPVKPIKQESFQERLRAVCPDDRTYRLDKVRAQFPDMDKSGFDRQMIALAGELKIELLAGDQRECNPDDLITDGNRLFVNFEWR